MMLYRKFGVSYTTLNIGSFYDIIEFVKLIHFQWENDNLQVVFVYLPMYCDFLYNTVYKYTFQKDVLTLC